MKNINTDEVLTKGVERRGDMMAKYQAWVNKLLPCSTGFGDQHKDGEHPYNKL